MSPLLRAAAVVEAVSLAVLLGNLLTVHHATVASVAGPVHGSAYLVAIAAAFTGEDMPRAARPRVFVPGVGGLWALRTRPAVQDDDARNVRR
ncbi:DUF3817 domain-containing protein [Streptomyces specialis]|uniref:DUF3817 domain-containing protein n=1 Tax=Streptomyces specialis TaxID=498367 RepID=UPI00073E6DBD|nr:DUF3817 domain-containing protein [Streptomyces specialis]